MNGESSIKSGVWWRTVALGVLLSVTLVAGSGLKASAANGSANPATGTGGVDVTITTEDLSAKQIQFADVQAGCDHSLGLTRDGKVYGWGSGSRGATGIGATSTTWVPTAVDTNGVLAGKTITQIAAGCYHSLALDSDGKVYAWGRDTEGQVGNDDTMSTTITSPVEVDMTGVLAGKTITDIAAGSYHSLAVDSDGNVYSWGQGGSGRLGNGSTTTTATPVAVDMTGVLDGVKISKVYGAAESSIALSEDGQLYGWGSNYYRQLASSGGSPSSPVNLNSSGAFTGKTITQVAAGNSHILAMASDGSIFAWGYNSSGQIGNGSGGGNVGTPVNLKEASSELAGADIVSIGAGTNVSFAVAADGSAYSWGRAQYGALGNGSSDTNVNTPQSMNNSMPLASISGGRYSHVLGLTTSGDPYGWGQGEGGKVGHGDRSLRSTPVQVVQYLPRVYFGGKIAKSTSVFVDSDTTVRVETPSHSAGPVDVEIRLGGDDDAYTTVIPGVFTYAYAPEEVKAAINPDGSANVSWRGTTSKEDATAYLVEYSEDGGATWTTRKNTNRNAPEFGFGANGTEQYKYTAELGGTHQRIPFGWSTTEPRKGQYNWTAIDGRIEEALAQGLEPMLQVGGANDRRAAGFTYDDFEEFMEQVAARYKGKVKHFEIWNEPHLNGFWNTGPNIDEYAAFLKAGYEGVKAGNPDTVVISAGVGATEFSAPDISGGDWFRGMVERRAFDYADAIGVHPYMTPNFPVTRDAGGWYATKNRIRDILREGGYGDKKFWTTEVGEMTVADHMDRPVADSQMTEDHQAQIYAEILWDYEKNLQDSYGPIYFYQAVDQPTARIDSEQTFGVVRRDGTTKPAYDVVKAYAFGFTGDSAVIPQDVVSRAGDRLQVRVSALTLYGLSNPVLATLSDAPVDGGDGSGDDGSGVGQDSGSNGQDPDDSTVGAPDTGFMRQHSTAVWLVLAAVVLIAGSTVAIYRSRRKITFRR